MTREEAHQVKVEDRRDYTNDHWEFIFDRTKHSKLINKIYDDFESMTCENCKWMNKSICFSPSGYMGGSMTNKDFGCNKFERKIDD